MAIQTTYLAKGHSTADAGDRFVRAVHANDPAFRYYDWCLRGSDLRYDIAQGTCDAHDLPADVREAADRRMSQAFSYVPWPR